MLDEGLENVPFLYDVLQEVLEGVLLGVVVYHQVGVVLACYFFAIIFDFIFECIDKMRILTTFSLFFVIIFFLQSNQFTLLNIPLC